MSAIDKMNSNNQRQKDADAKALGHIVIERGNNFVGSVLLGALKEEKKDILRKEAFLLLRKYEIPLPEELKEESTQVFQNESRALERKQAAARNAREKKEARREFNDYWKQRRGNPQVSPQPDILGQRVNSQDG